MICDTKNLPPKFQPSIRSKSARIKTMVKRKDSVNHSHCTSLALILIRADLLPIES
jgi:hypothetical protein